jgi:hypothetical protein
MLSSACRKPVGAVVLSGRDISIMALMISFPVMGLDEFLRTVPAKFSAQPYVEVQHWLTGSLMALPLFAFGIWAGDRLGALAGLGTARRADVLKRALVIALLGALTLVPVWFAADKSDDPVTAQPLVFPHAQDSGDVYWAAPWVISALVCVCLVPVAAWAAHRISGSITSRLATRVPRGAASFTRAAVLVALLAAVPVLAWLLYQAAGRAYASQMYYTSATSPVPPRSHVFSDGTRRVRVPASPPVTAAPFAVVYQAAHALQDGLAGQAAGLPVAAMALSRITRGMDGRNQHHPADT